MILKETIKKVEHSKEYSGFMVKNPEYYLVHAFTMLDEKEKKFSWEVGYYSKEKDRLVVFETEPQIKIREDEDVFKREGSPAIRKLDMHEVKISLTRAMEICDELVKDKYSSQSITKRIIIVQCLEKPIYNLTLVTRSFNVLNIKIDAASGEVLSHNLQNIMSLGKTDEK